MSRNGLGRGIWVALGVAALAVAPRVQAEEGGSGHYVPGSMASFADSVPPAEAIALRYNFLTYDGSYSRGQPLPIAGVNAVDVDAQSMAQGLTLLWRPPVEIADGLSYALSATIPYVWMDVSAAVDTAQGRVRRSDSEDGLGDMVVMPLMLSYTVNPDLTVGARVGLYLPTGDYETGRLANQGKNYLTTEPTLSVIYFGLKNGREAALFLGADFNEENDDTDYRSGTQIHADGTLAQHFPLAGGFAGAGVSGFWYEQVAGDSGAGATFGDFEGKTIGLGPVVSYTKSFKKTDVVGELKWLHETDTTRRPEGDYIWLKLLAKF